MFKKLRMKEPVNTLTHFAGAVLSLVALLWMLHKGLVNKNGLQITSAVVFGLSLVVLYTASTVYHWASGSEKLVAILRRVDHSMIYILIAGTYTPVCLLVLKGTLGYTLLGIVWGLAAIGIILKLAWFEAPRWLYTLFYLVLGWMSIFFIVPIYKALPFGGFLCLIGGGLLYSLGSVIYATKSKKIKISVFGFHEIFHLFVLAGSTAHYILVEKFILI